MIGYFRRTPRVLKTLFPKVIWNGSTKHKNLYLTFDDGPHSEITPLVLDILAQKDVKATFFCLGESLKSHPDIAKQALREGHLLGNHGYSHENGWKTDQATYLKSVDLCRQQLKEIGVKTNYFRPPYGRLMPGQLKALQENYEVVMWSLMSGDFDEKLDANICFDKLCKRTKSGDIVLFHDNEKAKNTLLEVLPRYLDFCLNESYEFKLISGC